MWAIASVFSVAFLARLAPVSAQTAEAKCLPVFLNLTNTKGQDPCLVSSYVQGSCNNGQWDVPALGDGSHYVGPYKNEINECQCSSVVYDLVSACGLCQNRTIVAWSTWSLNCTSDLKAAGAFNAPIPPGTSIPAWAYWNPETHGDIFSLNALIDTAGGAESTGAPVATNTNTNTRTQTRAPTSTKSSANTGAAGATGGDGGGGANVGAIVGGVVGGILGVGLLGVLGFWLIRRNTAKTPPSAQYTDQMSQQPGHPGLLSAQATGGASFHQGGPPQAWSPAPHSSYSGGPQQTNFTGGFNTSTPPAGYNGMGYAGGPGPGSVYGPTGTASIHSESRAGSTQPFNQNAFSPYQSGSPGPQGHFQTSPTPRPGVYQGAAEL